MYHPMSSLCNSLSLITIEEFVYSGIRRPGDFKKTSFLATPISSAVFPVLNTLGTSFPRADFDAGGPNVLHYHPRATETSFTLEGKI